MKLFWTCFGIDALVLAVLLFFFFMGLADGSVSSFNAALWITMLVVPSLVLWGGLQLRKSGRRRMATGLLAILAVPGLLLGGWMLLLIVLFSMSPGAVH
jgi:hypothetical protein